jgi:adenosylcobyric acid synthase
MIQGTSSNAGKSIMVAALCRIYANRGYKVAPFKSQNMSLNSFTTFENKEIAIAQVLQADASKIEPSVHMNPILLKPKGDFTSQVIIHGKAIGDMDFYKYQHDCRDYALNAIKESLNILKEKNDIIIIEGAGSPAEINMRSEDIANMEIAHIADANVILVADIDRGGVFASIAGTFQLLDDYDRSRLKAVIINKFSGNLDILQPGIDKIEKIIKAPILGVIPYDHSLRLPEEDSASLYEHKFKSNKPITIGVIKLPKIANFTDIDPFEYEEDVGLKLIDLNEEIGDVDAIIIPGTRNTVSDAIALKESGKANEIIKLSEKIPIIGICGGYQMLGNHIYDETKKESNFGTIKGLGLLNIDSKFERKEKVVKQSEAILANEIIKDFGTPNDNTILKIFKNISGEKITGFELHEGTTILTGSLPLFKIKKGIGNNENSTFDGAVEGNVIGTYFHGLFHNFNFRREFLNYLREKKGLETYQGVDPYETTKDYNIEKLAKIVEENINMEFVDKLLFN